ncbi:MAG: hypothetical protein GY758_32890, partial [Fuerstiella sp.]|nr:hypothetical protein [Fuerstiella sp.]
TGGNKRPRIGANRGESMLPPKMLRVDKTLKTNENAGFAVHAGESHSE